MTSLGDLYGKMMTLSRQVETSADALVREVATQVISQAARSTPIDTAEAILDWQIGVGSPPDQLGQALYPTRWNRDPPGPIPDKTPAVATVTGRASREIEGYRGTGTVYVSNAAPYIQRLNDGYSKQAPAGFVQLAVQAGLAAVRLRRFLR